MLRNRFLKLAASNSCCSSVARPIGMPYENYIRGSIARNIPLIHLNAQGTQVRDLHTNFSRVKGHFDTIILRDEVKEHERRTPLLPSQVSALIGSGYKVLVESSEGRIYPDSMYKEAGANIIPNHSFWVEDAITDSTLVLGLKELPETGTVLMNSEQEKVVVPDRIFGTHVYFAHAYKYQTDWQELMKRFELGNGILLDLEYLVDDQLRRIAAFGSPAGYSGMALGLLSWIRQKEEQAGAEFSNSPVLPYPSKKDLVTEIQNKLKKLNLQPQISVVGSQGRCGQGSLECIKDVFGTDYKNLLLWDREDTLPEKAPFNRMIESDIVVNDIFAAGEMEPIITLDEIKNYDKSKRRLSLFVDVSCDITSKRKAFPLNDHLTSFKSPRRRILADDDGLPLDVIAIDNLPTLLPGFSSETYSQDLFPYIQVLKDVDFYDAELDKYDLWKNDWINSTFKYRRPEHHHIRVWQRAFQLFQRKQIENQTS